PLSDVGLVKIFSHSVGCHFVLLTVSFALQKLSSFRRSHLLIVSLSVCAAGVLFRKWSLEAVVKMREQAACFHSLTKCVLSQGSESYISRKNVRIYTRPDWM
ncbi:hypothetical protein LEMLEM_LOCUS7268, partial [Lemmus lemmus]